MGFLARPITWCAARKRNVTWGSAPPQIVGLRSRQHGGLHDECDPTTVAKAATAISARTQKCRFAFCCNLFVHCSAVRRHSCLGSLHRGLQLRDRPFGGREPRRVGGGRPEASSRSGHA